MASPTWGQTASTRHWMKRVTFVLSIYNPSLYSIPAGR